MKKKFFLLVTLIVAFVLICFFFEALKKPEIVEVENNLQEISEQKLLFLAASMNKPTWSDVLLEGAEWSIVVAVSALTAGVVAPVAAGIKTVRSVNKIKNTAQKTSDSHTFLNKIIRPFYKSVARPFNKTAIQHVNKVAGVYIFFNKAGKVKYVGKAVNLKLRLSQHLAGPSSSGNLLLSKNAKSLAFVAVPVPSIGIKGGAIKCIEAVLINAFNDGSLYNKRIEKINKSDCRQLISN